LSEITDTTITYSLPDISDPESDVVTVTVEDLATFMVYNDVQKEIVIDASLITEDISVTIKYTLSDTNGGTKEVS